MFRSILAPLDGSSFAEQALPLAVSVARHSGARLNLVTVSTPLTEAYVEGMSFGPGELEQGFAARYQVYLDAVADQVRGRFAGPVTTAVLHGEVSAALCEYLGAGRADLVVMATHGRGALGRFWLGSVADEMLRLSPAPLLLVRPHESAPDAGKEPTFGRVVVPLDGTPLAEQVLEAAIALAAPGPEAEIVLMRAIHALAAPSLPEGRQVEKEADALIRHLLTAQERIRQEARRYLEGMADRLRQRGLRVRTTVVVEDSPAAAILAEATKDRASVIALQTHGRHGLSRFLLGSVADKVIRGATVPVLVQRSAE